MTIAVRDICDELCPVVVGSVSFLDGICCDKGGGSSNSQLEVFERIRLAVRPVFGEFRRHPGTE